MATSRLVALAIAFLTSYYYGGQLRHTPLAPTGDAALDVHPLGFFISAWRHWDSVWFLRIAEHGYGATSTAFFPLYPATVRLLSAVMGMPSLAGMLISVACFVGATVILYRLVRDDFDAQTAVWAVALLSFAPTSFFFQAVYSEALFLLLTIASFAFARRGRWLLAGAAGLLAALTRSAGVILLLPLAWMWLEQHRGSVIELPGSAASRRLLSDRRAGLPALSALLLIPAGIGVYMAYLQVRFGDPLEFIAAEHRWHRRLHLPVTAIVDGTRAAVRSVRAITAEPGIYLRVARLPFHDQWLTLGNLSAFLALVFGAALLVVCWRRLPAAYTVFAAASLLLPLSYPTHATPLLSMPRFVLVDFPLFVALAVMVVRRPIARWVMMTVFVAGMVLLTTLFANGMWVA